MNKKICVVLTLIFLSSTIGCGSSGQTNSSDKNSGLSNDPTLAPFENIETPDNFDWGYFINPPYQTRSVTELPIPVYLIGFTEAETDIVDEGIDIANKAVGFDIYEVIDEWQADARAIYKVNKISFDEDEKTTGINSALNIVGYTYSRVLYINNLHDAGCVITDFAIEIRANHVDKFVVAHELGHAMGIQGHALIDYENDTTTDLEPLSIMAAVTSLTPAMDDYEYMMRKQGELLLEYMNEE